MLEVAPVQKLALIQNPVISFDAQIKEAISQLPAPVDAFNMVRYLTLTKICSLQGQ